MIHTLSKNHLPHDQIYPNSKLTIGKCRPGLKPQRHASFRPLAAGATRCGCPPAATPSVGRCWKAIKTPQPEMIMGHMKVRGPKVFQPTQQRHKHWNPGAKGAFLAHFTYIRPSYCLTPSAWKKRVVQGGWARMEEKCGQSVKKKP